MFHNAVHPIYLSFGILVLDSFAGFRIVLHNFSCSAVSVKINLELYHVIRLRHTNPILLNQLYNRVAVKEGSQPIREIAHNIQPHRPTHKLEWNRAKGLFFLAFPPFQSFCKPSNKAKVFSKIFLLSFNILLRISKYSFPHLSHIFGYGRKIFEISIYHN